MKERILKLIEYENLTSTKFAVEIGVQPSSISHILSGRNNPSYDFIIKVLKRYQNINAEWLLLNKGPMLKSIRQTSIFDIIPEKSQDDETPSKESNNIKPVNVSAESITELDNQINKIISHEIEKIVIFYSNKTFNEYSPSQ